MEFAAPVQEAVAGRFIRPLEFSLKPKATNKGRSCGNVVEESVRTSLDREAIDPVRLDIPPGPARCLQHQHLQPTRNPGRPVLQVESRGEATDSSAHDDNASHTVRLKTGPSPALASK